MRLCTLAILLAPLAAGAACASVTKYQDTYTGIVNSGAYLGEKASLIFTYQLHSPDPLGNNGVDESGPFDNGLGQDQLQSGGIYGPYETGIFDVGGQSYALAGGYQEDTARYYGQPTYPINYVYDQVTGNQGLSYADAEIYSYGVPPFLTSADLTQPLTLSLGPTSPVFNPDGYTTFANVYNYGPNDNLSSSFSPTFFSSRALGALPEPSTWLMMIMGFGFIGLAMRRRLDFAEQRGG